MTAREADPYGIAVKVTKYPAEDKYHPAFFEASVVSALLKDGDDFALPPDGWEPEAVHVWRIVIAGVIARVFVELTKRKASAIETRRSAGTHDGGIFYENTVTCEAKLSAYPSEQMLYATFPAKLDLDRGVSRPVPAKEVRAIVEDAVEKVVTDGDL